MVHPEVKIIKAEYGQRKAETGAVGVERKKLIASW